MENRKKIIIGAVTYTLLLSTAVVALFYSNAQAEINKTESVTEGIDFKIFALGQDPTSTLIKTNADYEITGYPSAQVLIKNWDKLTAIEKATITNELNAKGYFELVG